jgi:hypothetical protein
MSAIPPNAVASVLQSGAAQREQAKDGETVGTAQAEAGRRAAAGPDAFVEIEATDSDTQVHTDSGGLGSQGRHDAPPEEEPSTELESPALFVDDQGRPHIDLSA